MQDRRHEIKATGVRTITHKNAVYSTISEFLYNGIVFKDLTNMCGSWSKSNNVPNCSLAVPDGSNVHRIVLLPVDVNH